MTRAPSQGDAGDRQQAAIGILPIHTVKHTHPHTNTQAVQGPFVILGKPLILIGISFGRTRPEPSLSILYTPPDFRVKNPLGYLYFACKLTQPLFSLFLILFLYFILHFIFIYFILLSYFYLLSTVMFRVIVFILPPPKN